ncbi:hypothetical protein A2933_01950 [Candidatus Nomurabacteria bacterium RIFCSPLOWO2_01_FULL_46_18]|uniref:(d)CMP kinase n=1 Tax=Candidatus Nomurabacteria bacterium RIFCSPLOWO2_01_FULL_46_18 TaxID=1801783 RepID=A0A1F6XBL8_9BACT|nr:MAG: hypothetical protein A2933_01950 [Candidatus Nomurabacteria bacterium RIFCSPLOWO2_01_FULL_46_18]
MKKEIITISGRPGAGKSSTADLVAKELGYDRFSSGDFMRKMALDREISLIELSAIAERGRSIDEEIDAEIKKLRGREGTVIDSRLAYHFIPESFKVFLDLSLEISRERVLKDLDKNKLRKMSDKSKNTDEVYAEITRRLESEHKRYKKLYGIEDYTAKQNYDLIVDTNKNNLQEVAEIIVKKYRNWLNN